MITKFELAKRNLIALGYKECIIPSGLVYAKVDENDFRCRCILQFTLDCEKKRYSFAAYKLTGGIVVDELLIDDDIMLSCITILVELNKQSI